jgi:hypothetical protein
MAEDTELGELDTLGDGIEEKLAPLQMPLQVRINGIFKLWEFS